MVTNPSTETLEPYTFSQSLYKSTHFHENYSKLPMTIPEQIAAVYERRKKAHDELLACDIELDEILQQFGYKIEIV